MTEQEQFMKIAIELSYTAMRTGTGGPFGAVVVKDGKIIARGMNLVHAKHDPTAHAEMVAIRKACQVLQTAQLAGCEIYTSCEPCPMCLGAIYWARPDKIYYANTKTEAAAIGFDDQFIYDEIDLPIQQRHLSIEQLSSKDAQQAFEEWKFMNNKIRY